MPQRSTLYLNALVRTLSAERATAEAILTKDGRIVDVGSISDVRENAGGQLREVDLGGATVLPGFVESHNHFLSAGLSFADVDVRGEHCRSIDELQHLIRERAEATQAGEWVVGKGYDQTLLQENRHPTCTDLDAAAPDHPVVIFHVSFHGLVANTRAMEAASLDSNTPDVPGGEIGRDERGKPTGLLLEDPAMGIVMRVMPEKSRSEMRAGLGLSSEHYLERGVTAVHDALIHSREEIGAYAEAIAADELPIRAYLMIAPSLYDGELELQPGDLAESYGLPANRLVAGPVKLFQDGAIQAYTAALIEPYFDAPERYGVKIYEPAELHRLIDHFHRAGLQIAIHGNGDSAIDDILDGYEAALAARPRDDHRHRIEHCQTARPDQLERMARLGVVSSVFINHLWHFGDRHIARSLGPERAHRLEPLASMTRLGITWGLHSDYPVTQVDPLMGIWLAVNRRTSGGQSIGEDERVSVDRALRGFGPDAAFLGFQERAMGMIAPGYLADFVVLNGDPVAEPDAIKDLSVIATVINGEIRYERSLS
jgi:predicted amidohydrolase YtcJ